MKKKIKKKSKVLIKKIRLEDTWDFAFMQQVIEVLQGIKLLMEVCDQFSMSEELGKFMRKERKLKVRSSNPYSSS